MKYNILFEILLLLSLSIFIILFYKSYIKKNGYIKNGSINEGFQQEETFILKENGETYDDFYGEIYDNLMLPEERVTYEMDIILRTLQPDKPYSNMLDIGSGTGVLVKYLKDKGYNAYGVDKSKDMVNISKSRYDIDIKYANVEQAMAYDRSLFTHIFCMNFTIYEMESKTQMLKNCYYWLQNNGYLILHLAEKDRFNTIIPGGKSAILDSIKQLGDKRVTTTIIDFSDFIYKSEFNGCNEKNNMIHKETFTDKITNNIRQNERLLQFDTFDEIIGIALNAGFVAKGYFTMENGPSRDVHQRIYILERML
jgi:2-polyprenyl-3-methyl-5-hydroxy-6-metoxy-1,4-benzoquinol methylase